MSIITTEDVRHLAELSSLQLTDDEAVALGSDPENILAYFEQLKELDTTGVEPTYQVNPLQNVWRDDSIDQSEVDRSTLLALTVEQVNNSIKVPQVL